MSDEEALDSVVSSRRGRPLGVQGPRKDAAQLSTNKSTVKARARLEKMSEEEKAIARAENTERSAISTCLKKTRTSQAWLNADQSTRKEMEGQARLELLASRYDITSFLLIIVFLL